jgi:hypothetical protein
MKGYCVKCKTKVEMKDAKRVESNNRARMAGTCAVCKTKVNVFVKST